MRICFVCATFSLHNRIGPNAPLLKIKFEEKKIPDMELMHEFHELQNHLP